MEFVNLAREKCYFSLILHMRAVLHQHPEFQGEIELCGGEVMLIAEAKIEAP